LIGAFVLTLVFILIIAYRYVKNQKREKTFIAQQQKAEEEIFDLLKSHQIKLNEVKITEQNRISYELHDGILNKLYSIRFQLEMLNKSDAKAVKAQRENYIDMLQKLEEEIRAISHELKTDLIDSQFEYGPLLENLILEKNEFKITTFVHDIDKQIDWENISGLVKITIYRIVQEALHNVVKYANAEYCVVSISGGLNSSLELTITDDGKGFEVATVGKGGIGLRNMQERAKSIQAKFSISSVIGEGTKIQVVFENSGSKKE
jgi:signal transduction histidine kinase